MTTEAYKSTWPTHPNGSPKKIGEMTHEERRAQFRAAILRLKPEMESTEFAAALHKAAKNLEESAS